MRHPNAALQGFLAARAGSVFAGKLPRMCRIPSLSAATDFHAIMLPAGQARAGAAAVRAACLYAVVVPTLLVAVTSGDRGDRRRQSISPLRTTSSCRSLCACRGRNGVVACDQPASTIRQQCQDLRRSALCAPSWRRAVIAAPVYPHRQYALNTRQIGSGGSGPELKLWRLGGASDFTDKCTKALPGGQQPSARCCWML
ncbi:hypothetical protein PC115_g2584 [Phytophthora cactorum]|uniref:Uncharacterized protein n=1 Tax=Phytophthora cactorum TaxID=29920 RepID=A0A8T1DL90_9STRA|nr:hypothetical protein PC115_g2584 [Phytophthora cactorum]